MTPEFGGASFVLTLFPALRFSMSLPKSLVIGSRAIHLGVLLMAPVGVQAAYGQDIATFRVEENIRSEPQGVVLGRVLRGVGVPVLSTEGQWVQVNLGGWIWTSSLQSTELLGFDLVVSVAPQENLRTAPSGEVIARLVEGTLLDEMEGVPGWTRVERAAWVWAESVELTGETLPPASVQPPTPAPEAGEERWWQGRAGGAPVLSGPDGDTLALTRPGTELRILAREGNWIRVRLDGWSWAPEGEGQESTAAGGPSDLTPDQVVQDPEGSRGRTVTWELQFVSLERAEQIRTDFYEGEPFLLARTGTGDNLFVYIAVPPERLGEVDGLIPLERIRVVGRIRTGAAALTGNPILDLLEFTRLARD
jgi:hypothetical protein